MTIKIRIALLRMTPTTTTADVVTYSTITVHIRTATNGTPTPERLCYTSYQLTPAGHDRTRARIADKGFHATRTETFTKHARVLPANETTKQQEGQELVVLLLLLLLLDLLLNNLLRSINRDVRLTYDGQIRLSSELRTPTESCLMRGIVPYRWWNF